MTYFSCAYHVAVHRVVAYLFIICSCFVFRVSFCNTHSSHTRTHIHSQTIHIAARLFGRKIGKWEKTGNGQKDTSTTLLRSFEFTQIFCGSGFMSLRVSDTRVTMFNCGPKIRFFLSSSPICLCGSEMYERFTCTALHTVEPIIMHVNQFSLFFHTLDRHNIYRRPVISLL